MKRTIAILLTVLLLIACLPLTAMAAKTDAAETSASTEQKFRLLLEDLELVENVHQSDRYFYEELGQYPAKNPEWVLIRGGLYDLSAKNNIKYQYATVGNKLLRGNVNSSPFKLGYGVYDVKTGAFYDILDAWNMNLNNLRDTWDSLAPRTAYSEKDKSSENGMFVIGDADIDGSVTIMDATRIQRCIAELDENPWENFSVSDNDYIRGAAIAGATDYDRDGSTTVMDATRIQRGIADLPNNLTARIVLSRKAEDHGTEPIAQMLYSHSAANKYVKSYTGESLHSALLPDEDFSIIMIAGVYLKLNDTADKLTIESAQIDSNGVLNLNFKSRRAEKPNGEASPRLVLVSLPNTFVDDIKDIKVNLTVEGWTNPDDPNKLLASVVYYSEPAANRPSAAEATAQGYRMIDSQRNFSYSFKETYGASPAFDQIIANSKYRDDYGKNGFLGIIKTPAQFKYLFPNMNAEGYDEAFFKNTALVVLMHQGENFDDSIELSHLAVKDGTLYGQMIYLSTPYSSPKGNIYYDVHKVALSDVADVRQCALWDDPMYSHNCLLTPNDYFNGIPEKDEPTSGSRRINAVSVYQESFGVNKENSLYYTWGGVFFNSSQYNLFNNTEYVPSGGASAYDDYAYLSFYFRDKTRTAKVSSVYQNGDVLEVYVNETKETGTSDDKDHLSMQVMKIRKSDLKNIKSIRLYSCKPAVPTQPLTSVVSCYHPDAGRPFASIAMHQGYVSIDSERVFNGNYQASYGKNDVFNTITGDSPFGYETYYGYMAVIKTPEQFKYIFPERDASAYNESYFKTNALVALVHRGGNYSDKIYLSHLAVKDGTLYGQMVYLNVPSSEPMNNIYYDVCEVEQSDVAAVTQCALWDDSTYSRNYVLSPEYYSALSDKTDIPGSSYHRLGVVSVERVVDHDIDVNMYYGQATSAMLVNNPYQYRYFLKGRKVPGGDGIMDDNALLTINFVSKTSTATVKAVYTDGETLDVFLTESPAKNDDGSRSIKTLQTLRFNKSDINTVKSIRLYTGVPTAPLLYAEIPPESQQTVIPETPWDQGYIKVSSDVITLSAPDPYYFDLNGSPLDNDVYPGYVMLIKSRSELEKLLPGFDTEKKYDDTWFESYSIIGMLGYEEDGYGGHAEIGLSGVKDNTLYIEAGVKHPEYGDKEPTTTAMDIPVYTFRAVIKGYVKNVTDLKLWCGRANETGTVYTELPYWNQTPEMPLDPSAEGYKTLSTTPITVSSPAWNKFGFDSTPLGRPYMDTGYVVVIRSRAGFEKYLPGFDTEKKYDEAWFKTNAMVCALIQGNDYYSKAYLNNIAVKGNTLYASAGESIDQQYDENGNPVMLPVAPLVHKFLQVKQSDVANITAVSAWASPYPPYDTDISFYVSNDHQPDGGSYSETNAGYHITKKDDVAKTIQKLYTGADGKPAERDDFTYNIEKFSNNSDFSYQSFIAMRVYQGSSMAKVTVDRVYRTGKNELTVDVTRQHESNTESPDSCWRMIIVRIGAYGKDFSIKLNVQDKEGTAIVANPVNYFSMNNNDYNDFWPSQRKDLDYTRAFRGSYTIGSDCSAFTDICGNVSDRVGFIATVRSVSQFNYLFPENLRLDNGIREKYNDAFFKDKALAVLVYKTNNYEERISLSSPGVVNNTLFGAMTTTTPLAVSPMSVIKFDALEINQRDIADVNQTALWKKPYLEKDYVFKQYSGVDNVPGKPNNLSGYTALNTEEVGTYTVKDYISGLNPGFVTYPNVAVTFNRDQFNMIAGNIDGLTISDKDFEEYLYFIVVANGTYAGDTAAVNGVYLDNTNKVYAVDAAISAYQEGGVDPAPEKDKHATIVIHRIKKSVIAAMNPNNFFNINTVVMWNSYLGNSINGFWYEIDADGNAEITKYVGSQTRVAVPDYIYGRKVVAIRDSAFEKCTSMISLSIPRCVKSFGAKAAKDCTSLERVTFAGEVYQTHLGVVIPPVENESIGDSAFEGCTALTTVSLPEEIKTIGSRAFYGCTELDNFKLPASVTAIADYTFANCESMYYLYDSYGEKTISVKTVGDYAFFNCRNLRSVKFTDTLISIGKAAFRSCGLLSEVSLEENLKTIGANVFLDCPALKMLTVPKSVTTIVKHALGYTLDQEITESEVYYKRDDFTIRGYAGSTAQTYANQYGFTFEAI